MSRVCQLTGKKTSTGNNRPFSLKATKRKFRINLFKRRVKNPITGKIETMTLSAKAIKTLKKRKLIEVVIPDIKKIQTKKKNTNNEKKERVKKIKLTPKQKKELAEQKEKELIKSDKTLEESVEIKKDT